MKTLMIYIKLLIVSLLIAGFAGCAEMEQLPTAPIFNDTETIEIEGSGFNGTTFMFDAPDGAKYLVLGVFINTNPVTEGDHFNDATIAAFQYGNRTGLELGEGYLVKSQLRIPNSDKSDFTDTFIGSVTFDSNDSWAVWGYDKNGNLAYSSPLRNF